MHIDEELSIERLVEFGVFLVDKKWKSFRIYDIGSFRLNTPYTLRQIYEEIYQLGVVEGEKIGRNAKVKEFKKLLEIE